VLDARGPLLDARLAPLAEAIADGHIIDWDALESSSLDEHELTLIARLRTVAQIAQIHDPIGTIDGSKSSPPSPSPLLEPHTCWGSLRILAHVGSGRFGDVYRAFDPALDREVALKLLRSAEPSSMPAASQLADEALVVHEGRLMARLRHPNIVTIFGAQRIDGRTGIWMELVEGQTLEAELNARGPFRPAEVASVGVELCRALAAVHAAGLVHRDVKAQNVLREATTGRVVLGDFGTGREVDDLERERGIAGTPAYLAPEIFERSAATSRSDLYSLGTLLFHLATGSYPVLGRTLREVREAHVRGRRRMLRTVRHDVPARLASVIDRALAPGASDRYESAAAMETALVEAQRTPPHRMRAAAAALGLVILSLGLAIRWMGSEPDQGVTSGLPSASLAGLEFMSPSPDREAAAPMPAAAPDPPVAEKPDSGDEIPRSSVPFRGVAELTLTRINPEFSGRIRIYNGTNPRLVTCTVRGRQAIALCDLETGDIRELRAPSSRDERGEIPRLSPDGSRVAYAWYSAAGAAVRVMSADGSADRELLPAESSREVTDIKWMVVDDALIVRRVIETDGERRLGYFVVPLDGRPMWPIQDFEHASALGMDISPDGRRLVVQRDKPGGDSDLVVLDGQTGEEHVVAGGSGEDSIPRWTPDGRAVLYRSDVGGVRRLYIQRMEEGVPRGDPIHLQDFTRGMVTPIGFMSDGTLLIERLTHWYNTFRAAADLSTGLIGAPRPLDLRAGSEETPGVAVSRTGRVAYVGGTLGDRGLPARVLVLQPDGRMERELRMLGHVMRKSRVRWSADGSRLAVSSALSDRAVIEIFHVATAERERVIDADGAWDHHWDPFANAIYYAIGDEVRRHDLVTDDVTSVYRSKARLTATATFGVSPTDASLLLPISGAILIVSPDGQTILRSLVSGLPAALAWTPDGSQIVVSTIGADRNRASVVVMGAHDGDPVPLEISAEPLTDIAFSPDARELFFAAGNQSPGHWILSGLPRP
jgi:serine/threonine protein kinase/Tol biopolymer transport system component